MSKEGSVVSSKGVSTVAQHTESYCDFTPSERFQALRTAKIKRRHEQSVFGDLKNKVSLLQKEEQRVLNKIICIGTLKNRISDVRRINEEYQRQIEAKQTQENLSLKKRQRKIEEARRLASTALRNRQEAAKKSAMKTAFEVKAERIANQTKQLLQRTDNQSKVARQAENNRKNHEMVFQVQSWEREARLVRRLEKERRAEEAKLRFLKASNSLLRHQKAADMEALLSEQLIQEDLFGELKRVILNN